MKFNLKKALIVVTTNTAVAANFLSRLDIKVTEKNSLEIWKSIQATPIALTTYSLDVSDEDQFFLTQADNDDETKKRIFLEK